jgi:nucleoid-associated protein EbfC
VRAGAGSGRLVAAPDATDDRRTAKEEPPMSMANLQRMAQQMQRDMARVQEELETAVVEGTAGGGVVKATATGKQEILSITIDPDAVDPDDVEMLQDLVLAAVNEALNASRALAEAKLGAVTGGLRIPGM